MDHSIWLIILLLASTCIGSPAMYGEITFHHGPQGYPNNAQKSWLISVPKGFEIKLNFLHLDIEPSENCEHDSVQLIVGDEVKEKLCGFRVFWSSDFHLHTKHFSTNQLRVNFTSNESNMDNYTGFSLTFAAVDVNECEKASKNNCSHFCNNYIGGYFCSCNLGYFLLPDNHTCADVDCGPPAEIRNGFTSFSQTTYSSEATYSCVSEYYTLTLPPSGDGTFLCSSNGLWVSKDGGHKLPKCVPVCGHQWSPIDEAVPTGRIMGGKAAEIGNFPWQVLLSKNGRSGGAVIGEHWVLTAAQVLWDDDLEGNTKKDPSSINIFLGGVDVDEQIKMGNHEVSDYHLHPDFNRENFDNDIALVRLKNPLVMNLNVSPVCLPEHGNELLYEDRKQGLVSGYGMARKNRLASTLQYVPVPMASRDKCERYFSRNKKDTSRKTFFSTNMFCAGFPEAGHGDSCQGDSGGAYVAQKDDGTWVSSGIVSWGIGCNEGYGVYTKVTNYLDWILGYTGKLSA